MKAPILIATLLVSALGLAGCTDSVDTTDPASSGGSAVDVHEGDLTIDMVDVGFSPKEVRIHAGTLVTWVNRDDMGHAVSPDDKAQWGTEGSGDAPDQWMNQGDTWSWTFTTPGTYHYHCPPHATKAGNGYMGMVGTIIVV